MAYRINFRDYLIGMHISSYREFLTELYINPALGDAIEIASRVEGGGRNRDLEAEQALEAVSPMDNVYQ